MNKHIWMILALLVYSIALGQDTQKPQEQLSRSELIQKDIDDAIKKLSSNNFLESEQAKRELLNLGKSAVPSLIKTLESSKPEVKYTACELLGDIRDVSAVPALTKALLDYEEYGKSIASAAAKSLGKLGDEKVIPDLEKMLQSERSKIDVELRYEIILALGNLRAMDSKDLLKKFIEDKGATYYGKVVSFAAIEALGKIRAKDAVEDIAKLLTDKTREEWSGNTLGLAVARTLQILTSQDLGPLIADNDEKTKATLKKWSEWWDKELKKKEPPKVEQPKPENRIAEAYATMYTIHLAINKYKESKGSTPAENLSDLVTSGFLKEVPKDPWGRDFFYHQAGAGSDYVMHSYGADGKEHGSGLDADIMWTMEMKENYSKIIATKDTLKTLVDLISSYRQSKGQYPAKLEDLLGETLKTLPKDGWEKNFVYKIPGTNNTPYELISLGADGKEGGTGVDEDIKWQEKK